MRSKRIERIVSLNVDVIFSVVFYKATTTIVYPASFPEGRERESGEWPAGLFWGGQPGDMSMGCCNLKREKGEKRIQSSASREERSERASHVPSELLPATKTTTADPIICCYVRPALNWHPFLA